MTLRSFSYGGGTQSTETLGRGEFYLTRYGDFITNLFDGNQETLFDDESDATCDTGHCMT